jgi:type IV secretion system protein VirD4
MFSWKRKPEDKGIYLGHYLDRNGRVREPVYYPGTIHGCLIGPNGSGKGTGLIINNIASLRRSLFIIDPKGEAAAITARARAKLGRVLIINPFNVLAADLPHLKDHGFNPLAAIDPCHDNFIDDATETGISLVKEQGDSNARFFSGSAQDFVSMLVGHECVINPKKANLGNVRRMLTEPLARNESGADIGLLKTIREISRSHCEPLKFKAGRFLAATRSNMDIVSTAINETRFLDSPPIRRSLCGPGFDWDAMKREIITCYLILPADRLESHANYLRLIVTSALRTLLRSPPGDALPPVLFLLDEFAQLDYLPPVEKAMGIARGFGVQLLPVLQDLNQLNALYKDRWQSFIANAGFISALAPRDMFTAKYLSDLCGKQKRNVRSQTLAEGKVSFSDSPHDFDFLRPEELMKMSAGQSLNLVSGRNPFFTRAVPYWELPHGRDLDPNPYYKPFTEKKRVS